MRNTANVFRMAAVSCVLGVVLSACGDRGNTQYQDTLMQDTASGMVADIRVSEVTFGKSIGADMRVTTPVTVFSARDTVHVAIATTGSMTSASVLMMVKPVGDSVAVVQDSKTISPTGPAVTTIQIAKPDVMRPGKYVVEVFLNGGLAVMKEIEIVR